MLGQSRSDCPLGSTTIPDGFGTKWKCFQVVNSSSLFLTANSFCNSNYHGNLVSVPNAFVNMFVAGEIL